MPLGELEEEEKFVVLAVCCGEAVLGFVRNAFAVGVLVLHTTDNEIDAGGHVALNRPDLILVDGSMGTAFFGKALKAMERYEVHAAIAAVGEFSEAEATLLEQAGVTVFPAPPDPSAIGAKVQQLAKAKWDAD